MCNTGASFDRSVQESDPEEVELQLILFHGSEVRATIYPAVMKQYNLSF